MGRDYQKIKAFEVANQLVVAVYEITKGFPKTEIFGLTSQVRRSVVSVACNIVEGSSRQHKRDYLNFLYNAEGSMSETIYLLDLAKGFNYIAPDSYLKVSVLAESSAKILYGLIEAVKREV